MDIIKDTEMQFHTMETMESIEKMTTSNYFDYQISNVLRDHCMMYSLFLTTIFTIGWQCQDIILR